jgi:hypothetical protein
MHPEVTYNTGCGASEPLPWRTERAKETTVKKKKKKKTGLFPQIF